MRTFAETFYNLNEGELGGSTPANRTGENITGYHEPPGPVPRKKRVRVRSPGKQPAVSIKEQMAVVQIRRPKDMKWLEPISKLLRAVDPL